MKKQLNFFILFTITFFSFLLESTQISSIKEVFKYVNPSKRTLIIFDIDNTILEPKTDLGSDQWFCHLIQENSNNGMDRAAAIKHVLPIYFHVNLHIDLIKTEPTLVDDIALLEQQCEHVICLTARSFNLGNKTLEQLHNNGLHFSIPELEEFNLDLPNPSIYKDGVLFCGANTKGDVLLSFLNKINYTPELIIFVDDKESYLQLLEVASKQRNIEFIGLRYAGCDERVRNFNTQATELELQEFLVEHPFDK